jgi:hypothetical protein
MKRDFPAYPAEKKEFRYYHNYTESVYIRNEEITPSSVYHTTPVSA